ncbi:type II toxin-antitoxin system RelE/ParE family toxin [Pasteurella multocida]|uniref:type II toxin-antitoxin system RelE/ParE family toxin n=1 Tax=Pasteurella multocida TaxID=747 RepID=UPI00397894CA
MIYEVHLVINWKNWTPKTSGLYSIRVNVKYRLIFKYKESNFPKIIELRLDKHQYRL